MENNLDKNNLTEDKIESIVYQNWDLRLMEKSFEHFCEKYKINYLYAKEFGTEKSKIILKEYYLDELDGNLSKDDCDHLYSLMEDPWDCSKLMRHKILAELISHIKSERNYKKILILGAGLGGEYHHLRKIFAKANYYITDVTKNALNSFKRKHKENNDYNTHILDAFSGKDLFEFVLKYGKFDLVIASGVYRYAPNKLIRKNAARFVYKHYLQNNGMLCIVEVRQDPKFDDPLLLNRIKPIVNKIVQTKTRINPTHFVFYSKNKSKGDSKK